MKPHRIRCRRARWAAAVSLALACGWLLSGLGSALAHVGGWMVMAHAGSLVVNRYPGSRAPAGWDAGWARYGWTLWPAWGPVPGGTHILVPLWIPLVLMMALTAALWLKKRRPAEGRCAECGYNLAGSVSAICPECGEGVNQ